MFYCHFTCKIIFHLWWSNQVLFHLWYFPPNIHSKPKLPAKSTFLVVWFKHTIFVAVVWKKEVWNCWINVLSLKSSFTGIWSSLFYDIKIFNKVGIDAYLRFIPHLLSACQPAIACASWIVIFLHFFYVVQHTQGVLHSSRYFITHFRSYWKVAPWGARSSCCSTREFLWSTSIWWGEVSNIQFNWP